MKLYHGFGRSYPVLMLCEEGKQGFSRYHTQGGIGLLEQSGLKSSSTAARKTSGLQEETQDAHGDDVR